MQNCGRKARGRHDDPGVRITAFRGFSPRGSHAGKAGTLSGRTAIKTYSLSRTIYQGLRLSTCLRYLASARSQL